LLLGIALASVLVEALHFPNWAGYGLVGLVVAGVGVGLFFSTANEKSSRLCR
jgi:hypothetical protein